MFAFLLSHGRDADSCCQVLIFVKAIRHLAPSWELVEGAHVLSLNQMGAAFEYAECFLAY